MEIDGASGPQAATPGNDAEENLDRDLDELFEDGEFDDVKISGEAIEDETDVETDAAAGEGEEPDEADEADEDAEEDAEGGEDEESDGSDDVERVRSGMQKRIDRLTAQKKDLEEKFKDAGSEIEQRKQEAETAKQAALAGIDPEYADPKEAELVQEYNRLARIRDWCREYVETGYDGAGGDDPSFEPEDIRKHLDSVQDELIELAPQARRVRDGARRRMQEDLELGRKARKLREQKRSKVKQAVKKKKKPAAQVADQTAGRVAKTSKSRNAGIDRKAFEEGGRTDESLMDSMGDFFD